MTARDFHAADIRKRREREAYIAAEIERIEGAPAVDFASGNLDPRQQPWDPALDAAFAHLRTWNPFTAPPGYVAWGDEVPDPPSGDAA